MGGGSFWVGVSQIPRRGNAVFPVRLRAGS
nr:MAG TPA: hypothetical protein [Caudoviricetes sp.]